MTLPEDLRTLLTRLQSAVLRPLQQTFVGKGEIIDLLGIALIGRENLFLMGPPGTAKSALVQELVKRIQGQSFDYLLTRFTEPNELFGPFDIRKLREGELVTNKEGMLPEADIVFLDELLNANSAVLNSLLMALNERIFRRGRETIQMPMLLAVGASNHLPEDDALQALFDRFLLRVHCDNVPLELLQGVVDAGWELERRPALVDQAASNGEHEGSIASTFTTTEQMQGASESAQHETNRSTFTVADVRRLQAAVREVDVSTVRRSYIDLIQRLRYAGVAVSDRRAVKFQRLLAASALLAGRDRVNASDLWVLRYTWDTEEQQSVLAALVNEAIERAPAEEREDPHPRARQGILPDAEALSADLRRIAERLQHPVSTADQAYLRDQTSILAGRCEWVPEDLARQALQQQLQQVWTQLDAVHATAS